MPGAHRVVGVETEYALVGRRVDGWRGSRKAGGGDAAQRLFAPIEREHASSNVFLRNGGRLYLDVGSHPEYATAECASVPDLLVHERAGDELVVRLARRAEDDGAADDQQVQLRLFNKASTRTATPTAATRTTASTAPSTCRRSLPP